MRLSLRLPLLLLAIAACGSAQPRAQVTEALTFLSGSRALGATHIAAGPDGDVYVAGIVAEFPNDVFVARLSGDLSTLRYLREFGGSNIDDASGFAVDRGGAAYLAGSTTSTDFPVTAGAWVTQLPGSFGVNHGGFLVKLDPAGEIAYSTFFPETAIADLAIDSEGRAVLVGFTRNPSFPVTADALRPVLRPAVCGRFCRINFLFGGLNCFDSLCADGFLARLLADGSGLDYATFLGADPADVVEPQDLSREPVNEGDDTATAVEIDSNGHIVVAGMTNSTGFPVTPGAYQSALNGDQDLFVMKLDPTGRTLLASTLFGGEGSQQHPTIAVDGNGDIHLGAASFDPNLLGVVLDPEGSDALVAKLSGDATRLFYVHAVGAGFGVRHVSPTLSPLRVAAMPDGSTLVVTPGPFETTPRRVCVESTYVTRLAGDDGRVEYSVGQPYFGLETALGADGAVYVGGASFETALSAATEGAYQTEPGGATASVISRVSDAPASSLRIDCVVNSASRGVWPKNYGGIPPDPHREDAVVSPGELLTFFGAALGPGEGAVADASSGVLPLDLGGTRIRIGGEPAALLYSQSSQVNTAAPFSLSGSHTLIEVERDGRSLAFWIPRARANPGVFTENYTGRGQAVIVNSDGTLNSVTNRARAGSMVTFFVSGLGRTALPETSGVINQQAQSVLPIPGLRVEIGGIEPDSVEVVTAKGMPAGVYEVRCRVPEQLEPGGGHWVTVFLGSQAASQILAGIAVE